jgi:hypothetical protein
VDQVGYELTYEIKTDINSPQVGGLSNVFNLLCHGKHQCHFVDFTVTRSTLEQVFSQFAKHQIAPPEAHA